MTRKLFIEDLPLHKFGPNTGRIDRKAAAKLLNVTEKQFHKAYNNWQLIFNRQPYSTLSLKEYFKKMNEAGINPDNLGNEIDSYHLSRYNDEGPYTKESCRFITKRENLKEAKKENPWIRTVRKYGYNKACKINQNASKISHTVDR